MSRGKLLVACAAICFAMTSAPAFAGAGHHMHGVAAITHPGGSAVTTVLPGCLGTTVSAGGGCTLGGC